MNIYRHVYAVLGLGVVLAGVSVANPAKQTKQTPTQVVVTNTAPMPVRDIGFSRSEARLGLSADFEEGDLEKSTAGSAYVVPAGKILVIDSVFLKTFGVPSGQRMLKMELGSLNSFTYPIPFEHKGAAANGEEIFTGAYEGKFWFPGGAEVRLVATRNSPTGGCRAFASIFGHLEDF